MQGNLIGEAETESLFHEIRTKFITLYLVGCGDSTHRCRRRRHEVFAKIYSTDRRGMKPRLRSYPHLAEYNKQDVTEKI